MSGTRTGFHAAAPILFEVFDEIIRQDKKWGVQNHDPMTWLGILAEEFGEAAKETVQITFAHPFSTNYRTELIQTAAVAIRAVETYDRKIREFELRPAPKAAEARAEIKGKILDDPDDFNVTHAREHQQKISGS